ncbi:MAG: hypothetical protein ABSF52_23820 [Syntrophobacteraceae bacterium]
MTCCQISRLVRLHKKAMIHWENYKELSKDQSGQSKALNHLMKADRLNRQISGMIRDISSAQVWIKDEKSPGFQFRSSQVRMPGRCR